MGRTESESEFQLFDVKELDIMPVGQWKSNIAIYDNTIRHSILTEIADKCYGNRVKLKERTKIVAGLAEYLS